MPAAAPAASRALRSAVSRHQSDDHAADDRHDDDEQTQVIAGGSRSIDRQATVEAEVRAEVDQGDQQLRRRRGQQA
jgi:hypothetical protein